MWEMFLEKASILHIVFLFVAVSFPGLVSMHVYRLLFAHHDIDWKTAFQESIFWGSINLAIVATPVFGILIYFPEISVCMRWIVSAIGIPVFVFILPALLPLLWSQMLRWKMMPFVVNFPCPTAWDWFFGVQRIEECFILVHLKNGEKIAGFYGLDSYATSFPRNGDLYLEKTVKVDNEGNFQNVVENTLGLLITRDEYAYVELFEVPKGEQKNLDSCQDDDDVVQCTPDSDVL